MTTIGFLGFGEAGSSMAAGLRSQGVEDIVAYDIAWQTSDLVARRADANEVELLDHAISLAREADVIISAVVCTEARVAASSVAAGLDDHHWFLDINSVSAGVKSEIAAELAGRGTHYVDVAVMANVSTDLTRLPLLVSGEGAADLESLLGVTLNHQVVSSRPGDAAQIKMFRSLFVKGLEALVLEGMMACYPTGTHERILATLDESFGKYSFSGLVQHLIERHAVHGRRRANELAEVAESLREVGVEPLVAEAAYRRMSWDVERGLQDRFAETGSDPDWIEVLDELTKLGE